MLVKEKEMKKDTPELNEQQKALERLKDENWERELEALSSHFHSTSPWEAAKQLHAEFQAKKLGLNN
jgi:hypothetical protein